MIVVGGGLAGLTCVLEVTLKGKSVLLLEREKVVGGRTSSYDEKGMYIKSGFHRFIGYYTYLPKVHRKAGIDPDKIGSGKRRSIFMCMIIIVWSQATKSCVRFKRHLLTD
ncbi:FAD-dependent oxidoreductase [Peribacillus saganii]|uniref:FAD-dependent oxidoreductase n=1 Tax=Peribacillus saganii TaxID=2303992 RepID=UPI003899A181